jgi:hypothetical protein
MHMLKTLRKTSLAVGLVMSLFAGAANAVDPVYGAATLTFEEFGNAGVGIPLTTYQGFSFDAGTYVTTAGPIDAPNNYLTMTDPATIRRGDGLAFYFDSVDYSARGGDTREFFFIYHFADGSSLDNRNTNSADPGNFKTSVGSVLTEASGISDRLITSFSIVSKQPDDITLVGLDNFRFRVEQAELATPVPEPETYAMLLAGLGLMGWVGRRRSRQREA